jgi:cyclase
MDPSLPRVIPILLLSRTGLVKTRRFRHPVYVGDPINVVRIFNDKEVDELVFLDIEASRRRRPPDLMTLRTVADECFMPFAFGGGISAFEQAKEAFAIGVEKVIINTAATERPQLIEEIAAAYGSQSVVGAVDVRRNWRGQPTVRTHGSSRAYRKPLSEWVARLEELGVGEILLTSVDRDGTGVGFDLDVIRATSELVSVPVIAAGGAGSLRDLSRACDAGAAAAAAGSLFVFNGPRRAVLITYPDRMELEATFNAGGAHER